MSRRTPPRLRSASSDSPCVNVCTVHPDGTHCMGCFRTVDEIARWGSYSAAEREAVLARLEARRAARREERRAARRTRNAGS